MDTLVGRFHAAMDAWMAVRHLRFGTLVLFMRATHIQYAPDQDDRVATAVQEMLTARDRAALAPCSFRQARVAAQGFPALERPLFGSGEREGLLAQCSDRMRRGEGKWLFQT